MQKKKSGVKKCLEILPLRGGGAGRLMANAILNFHFDYLHTSLTQRFDCEVAQVTASWQKTGHLRHTGGIWAIISVSTNAFGARQK